MAMDKMINKNSGDIEATGFGLNEYPINVINAIMAITANIPMMAILFSRMIDILICIIIFISLYSLTLADI